MCALQAAMDLFSSSMKINQNELKKPILGFEMIFF